MRKFGFCYFRTLANIHSVGKSLYLVCSPKSLYYGENGGSLTFLEIPIALLDYQSVLINYVLNAFLLTLYILTLNNQDKLSDILCQIHF